MAFPDVTAAPWSLSGALYDGSGVQSNGSAWGFRNAPNGSQYSAFLQGTSYISQTMNLVSGNYYTVSFYLSDRPGFNVNQVGIIDADCWPRWYR